tara:strand:- start:5226 stop:6011 length:786 start_codon:yes stop_codon:yes gene_type:complete
MVRPEIKFNKLHFKIISFSFAVIFFLPQNITAFDFSRWDGLLKLYVSPKIISGIHLNAVDYNKLSKDPVFNKLVRRLDNVDLSSLKNKNARLAFWINTYNILAIKIVLDHYPIESIKDAGSLLSPIWKKVAGSIGGTQRSLHEIEHDILRKIGDPRIHSAIVCASVSCPDLRRESFKEGYLDSQLNDQFIKFLGNPMKGLRVEKNKLYLSSIFKWFKDDFDLKGGIRVFLPRFVDNKTQKVIASRKLHVHYMDYNWNLNGF